MKPQGMLLDFEEALSQGFTNIFPVASVLADFLWWRKARRGSTMTVVITMTWLTSYKPCIHNSFWHKQINKTSKKEGAPPQYSTWGEVPQVQNIQVPWSMLTCSLQSVLHHFPREVHPYWPQVHQTWGLPPLAPQQHHYHLPHHHHNTSSLKESRSVSRQPSRQRRICTSPTTRALMATTLARSSQVPWVMERRGSSW